MARQRMRKRPMSQINVVPFIDVMLVMLVVFMITAPLLNQGVEVNLPQATSEPLPNEDDTPVIVSVDAAGDYFLNIGEQPEHSVDAQTLVTRIAAVLRIKPNRQILVRGDEQVGYGRVVRLMALLQGAGAPTIGLMTEQPDQTSGR